MLGVIVIKLIATASVVIGVSLAVNKLGPRLGGIIAGTPIILGPGYFFMLQERSVEFIQSAALSTLHALVATLFFSICFVMTAGRLSALVSLGLATVTIAQKGMLSLVAFTVVLAMTAGKLPPMMTFTASLIASLVVSAALFLVSQRQYQRALVPKVTTETC
ncbi:hypothetical protein MIH18_12730 [Marinobacter sp. M3C]|uniref:hypothetical protein n=1 Tax=Marinobacter sp. M3C TaxID=2917715 RepID=UPI0020108D54|nr:hypothetical protein [Marinobacter sp. M3C]UQG58628.1 hypothetical protein MIH18_12730 [Marinobacter sp. M3C]